MVGMEKILTRMRNQPTSIKFVDLKKVCGHYFGEPRRRGTSHRVHRTPWPGDPRVNIQDDRGRAKAYQVRQVPAAIEKWRDSDEHR